MTQYVGWELALPLIKKAEPLNPFLTSTLAKHNSKHLE